MANIMLRNQWSDFALEDALPALELIVEDSFMSFDTRYDKIFNVKQMRTAIAQSSQVSSLEPAGAVGEAEQVPLQRLWQGFAKTYKAVKYGLMLATSQELIDDMEYDVFTRNGEKLSKSFMSTVEIMAANVLNTGFSAAGPDGQALFSTAHPSLAPGVADISNKLGTPADLSMTSIKGLATLLRKTTDTAGNKIQIKPTTLIVSTDDEFLASELLESKFLVDSSNNNVNAINSVQSLYGIKPLVWDYLTDADAHFLAGDKKDHMLCFWWRKQPSIATEYDFKTEVALTKLTGRFDVGYSDFRGIVGTEGA